jgi:hypothetical protein
VSPAATTETPRARVSATACAKTTSGESRKTREIQPRLDERSSKARRAKGRSAGLARRIDHSR